MPGHDQESYQFGRFRVNPVLHRLFLGETEVPLTPKTVDVLLYLARNPGRPITKDELLKAVWADSYIEESNLAQHIFKLRKAFSSEPGAANLIRTLPGRGYQFTAEVNVCPAHAIAPAQPAPQWALPEDIVAEGHWRERTHVVVEETTHLAPQTAPVRRTPIAYTVGGAIVIALAGLAWHREHRVAAAGYRKVVLADFSNATGDPAFDRTLKRALEIDLAQSPYMDVLSERGGVGVLQLMGRRSDTAISADIAREMCERTNREVLISGTIAPLGRQYLLTLEATDCRSEKRVAVAKANAAGKDDVLEALDKVAEALRRGLNESAKSVEDYDVPLRAATTSSIEALKAYSVGKSLQIQGRNRTEIMAAFERAVELDPQFAMAWRELGEENVNLSQHDLAARDFQKAFDLSDRATMREQLVIRASFYSHGQRDLLQGIRQYELLASTYPQDPLGPVDVVDAYMRLGQYRSAVEAGEAALQRFPTYALLYENMAEAYKDVNRFDDSEAAAHTAERVGQGDTGLHLALFLIALARQDRTAMARETNWFDTQEDGTRVWYFPSFRGDAAALDGRYRQALKLWENAYQSALRAHLPETADAILIDQAMTQMQLGLPAAARVTLRRVRAPGERYQDVVRLQAALGEDANAVHFLAAHANPAPDTLLTYVFLPRLRAALAFEHGKPLDAIAALEPTRPYEMRDYSVPAMRGEAYLKARQPDLARVEFRKIADNPGIDPASLLYPLAYLGLARAYALEGDQAQSRREYEALLTRWKDADEDLPVVKQAKAEYAALTLPSDSPRR
jgi:DNA-binding winged helix-turn-helix (wHTH) protein/predicted Zn-dependent protease